MPPQPKILITGAAGQVGLDLVNALQNTAQIYATDVNLPADPANGVGWHRLDVTDAAASLDLFQKIQPDVVFHLAAVLAPKGELNPEAAYAVNLNGTHNVLEAARQTSLPRFIFPSTIAVFGPGLSSPVAEDVPTRPTTIYGLTKVAGELLGEYYHRHFDLDFRSVRFPGIISAIQPGGGATDYAVYLYTHAAAGKPYQAYCRPDTRIPLAYATDAIRALLELADAPSQNLTRRVYNVTAFSPAAREIADAIRKIVPAADLTFNPDPKRQAILDSWPAELNDNAARKDWGWRPRFTLDQMSAHLIDQLRVSQTLVTPK